MKHRMAMARTGEATGFRVGVVSALGLCVLGPVLLIVYQSFLSGPFFDANATFGLSSYAFIFSDPEFYRALWTTTLYAFGMVAVAVPLGAALAFLITRTDLRGARWLEPIVLVPMFLSAVVLAFGYTVSIGPSGFMSI